MRSSFILYGLRLSFLLSSFSYSSAKSLTSLLAEMCRALRQEIDSKNTRKRDIFDRKRTTQTDLQGKSSSLHFRMRPRISITWSVRRSVSPLVDPSVSLSVGDAFVKNKINIFEQIIGRGGILDQSHKAGISKLAK